MKQIKIDTTGLSRNKIKSLCSSEITFYRVLKRGWAIVEVEEDYVESKPIVNYKVLGQELKQKRESLDLSVEKVSVKTNVSEAVINALEDGKTVYPYNITLIKKYYDNY